MTDPRCSKCGHTSYYVTYQDRLIASANIACAMCGKGRKVTMEQAVDCPELKIRRGLFQQ